MQTREAARESALRDGMKEDRERGGERFVSITLREMESYYRYTSCCQRLHSEF